MRIFTLVLVLFSFHSSAALFGVDWGENIDKYGELTKRDEYYKVVTNSLPEHLLIAKQYELVQQPDSGLVKISMTSFEYSAFGDSFQDDYVELQGLLINDGYQTKEFRESELSSYQCIFQGECVGMLWVGVNHNDSIVTLEQRMNGRERSFIRLEVKANNFASNK
ncbi:hypothetical protein MSG37_14150 [Shewanella sp. 1CM18E]|uniref:hypothetical protein n=1 Tax=Shewanella sp. 1CM18E TaxID=2929169 RepID=UPI0020BEEE35|nr:hypothetical protein [Shewanella sp. 1CM18E]MCK8046026.1 hypothetical protein [Shewanella sp. 1CM18E]